MDFISQKQHCRMCLISCLFGLTLGAMRYVQSQIVTQGGINWCFFSFYFCSTMHLPLQWYRGCWSKLLLILLKRSLFQMANTMNAALFSQWKYRVNGYANVKFEVETSSHCHCNKLVVVRLLDCTLTLLGVLLSCIPPDLADMSVVWSFGHFYFFFFLF